MFNLSLYLPFSLRHFFGVMFIILLFFFGLPAHGGWIELNKLMSAIEKSDTDAVRAILDNPKETFGLSMNNKQLGWTPLGLAAAVGNVDIVRLLLQRGAKNSDIVYAQRRPVMSCFYGTREASPFMIASQFNHVEIMALIFEHTSKHKLKYWRAQAKAWGQKDLENRLSSIINAFSKEGSVSLYETALQAFANFRWQESEKLKSKKLSFPDVQMGPHMGQFLGEFRKIEDVSQREVDHFLDQLFPQFPKRLRDAQPVGPVKSNHPYFKMKEAIRDKTMIQRPIAAFRAARNKTWAGLYFEVMGRYPKIMGGNCHGYYNMYGDEGIQDWKSNIIHYVNDGLIQEWIKNPDLPITETHSSEAMEFTEELSKLTGRYFKIPTGDQSELIIRGLGRDGHITTTRFYFGDDPTEIENHAFVRTDKSNAIHGVHEMPAKAEPNSYGIFPLGNVFERDDSEFIRGGAHGYSPLTHASYFESGFFKVYRPHLYGSMENGDDVSFRVVEESPYSSLELLDHCVRKNCQGVLKDMGKLLLLRRAQKLEDGKKFQEFLVDILTKNRASVIGNRNEKSNTSN